MAYFGDVTLTTTHTMTISMS